MTYASQQLANALHELANEAKTQAPEDYRNANGVPAIIAEDHTFAFPAPVAKFLDQMEKYGESAKSVNVGAY